MADIVGATSSLSHHIVRRNYNEANREAMLPVPFVGAGRRADGALPRTFVLAVWRTSLMELRIRSTDSEWSSIPCQLPAAVTCVQNKYYRMNNSLYGFIYLIN